ncbi:MAG: ester cyclase [Bacteroidota bacterium]
MDTPIIALDALKRESWSAQESKNVALVLDFVQHIMNDHDFDYVLEKFGGGAYIQHNQSMPNGVGGVVDYMRKFAKQFPDFSYDVKHIYADGPYVIVHSHATISKKHRGNPKKGLNIKDTWKIENGQLVEHWDAIQPIDSFMRFYAWIAGGGSKNRNTLF